MKKILCGVALFALGFICFAESASANQVFICQSCTSAPGGDPNIITSTGSFTVGLAGGQSLQSPLIIIVGVYDGNGTPSLTFGGGVTAAVVGTYGLTTNQTTFTSGDAFATMGLTGAGGSESFVNWSAADVAAGFAAPTGFTLYAFQLNTGLASGSPITLGESGAANGSFIIAFGCQSGSTTSACANGNVGQTVFTNTGFVSTTPEPGTLLLLGSGLLGVGFSLRRRFV